MLNWGLSILFITFCEGGCTSDEVFYKCCARLIQRSLTKEEVRDRWITREVATELNQLLMNSTLDGEESKQKVTSNLRLLLDWITVKQRGDFMTVLNQNFR